VLGFGLIIPLLPFFVVRLGGGPEMDTANFMVPAFSAATLSVIACFCVFFFLPESLPAENRSAPATGKPSVSLAAQL